MTGKQVLAFEADPIYADLLRQQVELRGGQFEAVSDGIEGLDRAAELNPDLIYLCVELPRVSGFSICNKLRNNRKLSAIPIILSSAEAGEETFAKHRKLKKSADEYIHKPFDGAQIGPILGRFIGNGDLEDEAGDAESDSAVFVADDDEFEIEDVEMVEAGDDEVSVQMDAAGVAAIEGGGKTDENDIDAFADEAFAALEMGDEKEAQDLAHDEKPGAPPVQAKATRPASFPAPAVDSEAAAAFKEENEVLRRRVDELEVALERELKTKSDHESDLEGLSGRNQALIDKVSQLERELAESKASGGGEGVSSREFLELREALNKKDRELLDLRDSMNKREKQLLESREKLTELARKNADLEENNIAKTRRAHELEDKIRSLTADKELLGQKADDLQGRVERLQEKLSGTEEELDRVAFEKREEAKRLTKEKEDALEELTAARDQELAEFAEEKERERQEALEELEAKLEQERQGALEDLRTELEAEHERAREEALMQQRLRHEEQLEQRERELEADRDEQLENQKQDYEGRLEEMIRSHQETVDGLESQAKQQAARIEMLEETLRSLEDKKQSVEAALAETKEELEGTQNRLAETEDDLRGTVEELEETQDRAALLEGELDEYSDVLARNGRIVLKVREALNIIMTQLLEEVELGQAGQEQELGAEDEEFVEVDEVEDIEP